MPSEDELDEAARKLTVRLTRMVHNVEVRNDILVGLHKVNWRRRGYYKHIIDGLEANDETGPDTGAG